MTVAPAETLEVPGDPASRTFVGVAVILALAVAGRFVSFGPLGAFKDLLVA